MPGLYIGGYAFLSSCMYMTGIAASTAFGIFPYVHISTLDSGLGLTVDEAAAPPRSLEIGLAWFVPAMLLAIVYLFVLYRSFAGKVGVTGEGY
jgi:cytochrome bd ubiquinol oxidase subunit II